MCAALQPALPRRLPDAVNPSSPPRASSSVKRTSATSTSCSTPPRPWVWTAKRPRRRWTRTPSRATSPARSKRGGKSTASPASPSSSSTCEPGSRAPLHLPRQSGLTALFPPFPRPRRSAGGPRHAVRRPGARRARRHHPPSGLAVSTTAPQEARGETGTGLNYEQQRAWGLAMGPRHLPALRRVVGLKGNSAFDSLLASAPNCHPAALAAVTLGVRSATPFPCLVCSAVLAHPGAKREAGADMQPREPQGADTPADRPSRKKNDIQLRLRELVSQQRGVRMDWGLMRSLACVQRNRASSSTSATSRSRPSPHAQEQTNRG